jgi:hypothetical protein
LGFLELAGKELRQAQLEGVNRRENCDSIRVVDTLFFMIPHMLTQYLSSETGCTKKTVDAVKFKGILL